MNQRTPKIEKFDCFERRLLDAARVTDDQLEKIVGAPNLFDSVKSRIEFEQREKNFPKTSLKIRKRFPFLHWQSAAAACSLIFISIVGFIVANKNFRSITQPEQVFEAKISSEKSQQTVAKPDTPNIIPTVFPDKADAIRKTFGAPKAIKTSTASVKKFRARQTFARRTLTQPEHLQNANEAASEFYALTYAGNPAEANVEVKIVRAELSRSALFALGVNLPIENEPEKIKTDLLVGSDGIARAIRIVN